MIGTPDTLADRFGRYLARKLTEPSPGFKPYTHANVAALQELRTPQEIALRRGKTVEELSA